MTFREKLKREHHEYVNERYLGGCKGCPERYGYEDKYNWSYCSLENCKECWNREIPEPEALSSSETPNSSDLISRQAAIDAIDNALDIDGFRSGLLTRHSAKSAIKSVPPVTPVNYGSTICGDAISRQAAITALSHMCSEDEKGITVSRANVDSMLKSLPPAQPERTCVNCGRTANNGGWYADGGTRCPIEEHYALPKDGYCHLWEKRNITDDDYPERRTDG